MRSFTDLMFQGNTKAAIRLLTNNCRGKVLRLEDIATDGQTVLETLRGKHPSSQPCSVDALITSDADPSTVHPVVYEAIDAHCIRRATLQTFGAAGPSGTDAACWRKLCTAFKKASADLCHSIALVAKKLCSSYVDPQGLSPLLACRLIALSKDPGVRPIGICEVVRWIIAKAALFISKRDILEAAGPLQLCAGHVAGVEASIHFVWSFFAENTVEGALLVDASNAFNSLNGNTALQNIQHTCSILAPLAINCYRHPVDLFVGGTSILSEEGTTQGDPLAMPLYGLSTIPLIKELSAQSRAK